MPFLGPILCCLGVILASPKEGAIREGQTEKVAYCCSFSGIGIGYSICLGLSTIAYMFFNRISEYINLQLIALDLYESMNRCVD